MGTPTESDLKAMIQMSIIKNNKVTTDDVNLATKAYGLDIGELKGKTEKIRTTTVVTNIVEIPEELMELYQDLTVLMDELTVNLLNFLSTISHELYYRTAHYFTKPVAFIY